MILDFAEELKEILHKEVELLLVFYYNTISLLKMHFEILFIQQLDMLIWLFLVQEITAYQLILLFNILKTLPERKIYLKMHKIQKYFYLEKINIMI